MTNVPGSAFARPGLVVRHGEPRAAANALKGASVVPFTAFEYVGPGEGIGRLSGELNGPPVAAVLRLGVLLPGANSSRRGVPTPCLSPSAKHFKTPLMLKRKFF